LGAAHHALPVPQGEPSPAELDQTRAHLRRWGWTVDDASPSLALLTAALHALHHAHFDTSDALLDRYADAAAALAEEDVASVPTGSTAEAVRFVVLGTLLLEPVLLALRRLAHENAAGRGGTPDSHQPPATPNSDSRPG
ncbi:MAG: hypothetical protein JOY78_00810, partial [Pseudonocardia sp.]|nr:hypothetical protein [Pseudonocardia sp.]